MNAVLKERLVNSLLARNLVLVCGAGLSRAVPSNIPSAAGLAEECYDRYIRSGGYLDPAIRSDLEQQARHFFQLGQLDLVFIREVVDWGRFTVPPNAGHTAIADFLCCKAVELAISTNYDELIERAAETLGEKDLLPCIRAYELNVPNSRHRHFLKLHGCRKQNRPETLWCSDQLADPIIQRNIQQLSGWLQANLPSKDFVFLGFWSDWAYLNLVLEQSIQAVPQPSTVVLVDPAEPANLQAKAPGLWTWAQTAGRFYHEQVTANDFLIELRTALSERFFAHLFNSGAAAYTSLKGGPPTRPSPSPTVSCDRWYDVRRDLSGLTRDKAVTEVQPGPHLVNVGLALVELNEFGANLTEDGFQLPNGKTARILGTAGPLSLVKQAHANEPPARQLEDLVICACATEDPGVVSIMRPTAPKTVMRPGVSGTWLTLNDGLAAAAAP